MAYWLVKSEPGVYSWDDLVREKKTLWTGVRNFAARNNLRAMRVGDEAFFYHSNEGKAVVGIVKVVKEFEADPTVERDKLAKDGSNPWGVVTVVPVRALSRPVGLDDIKREKALAEMALVTLTRLSVQPVREKEWKCILEMEKGRG